MTKEEIHNICLKYDIENYTINDDLSIDVDGSVDLSHKSLTELPLKFKNVIGFFDCYNNPLESLKGIPLNLSDDYLVLPLRFTYSDYLEYSNRIKRDLKFKKVLK